MCEVKRGDIVFVELSSSEGSIQAGRRPMIIISNDTCCKHSSVLQVVALTTRLDKKKLPTHTLIEKGVANLKTSSLCLAETLMSITKDTIKFKIGSLDNEHMSRVNEGVMVQLGMC